MTAWSILALIYAQYPDTSVIERAARLIMSRQKKDGRWEQEDTEGIFNKNCAIDYPGALVSKSLRVNTDVCRCSIQIHLLHMGFGSGRYLPGGAFETVRLEARMIPRMYISIESHGGVRSKVSRAACVRAELTPARVRCCARQS